MMNYVLDSSQIGKLLDMGYFEGRRVPRTAVLIMPLDPDNAEPVVIDENGYKTPITPEQASCL
ncbi:MAG: hypothetical protein ACE5EI_09450 [Thermodesulfobacteriota bacterium]